MDHDPKIKQQLKDLLYHYLYDPVLIKFKQRQVQLIETNCTLINNPDLHFTYRGEIYQVNERVCLPRRLNRLDPRLYGEIDAYIAERDQLYKHEMPLVMGYVTQVLNMSDNYYDYLKAFPESVHRPFHQYVKVSGVPPKGVQDAVIDELIAKNAELIGLMKQRMLLNLLL